MGNLIWHEYARLVTITASIYTVWASYWAFFYRKFFWDFLNGTIRIPGGLQPSNSDAIFTALIVKAPIIPIISMVLAFFILAMELPLPQLKNTSLHRSFVLRIVLLIVQSFLAILFYQGTNGALWSIVSAICYGRAVVLGEIMPEAKGNRGKGEHA